ncbi:MAG: 5-oxoprolinase subunit C family protein [Acidimicrobiales bacterium]
MIAVDSAGPGATVQDLGRYGYQALGFSSGGAIDVIAHRWANWLVGNDPSQATVEMMLRGADLRFVHGSWVAVTGAVGPVWVDDEAVHDDWVGTTGAVESAWVSDEPVRGWTAFWARAGSTVRVGIRSGVYAYLAVRGGVSTSPVMGSRSTDLTAGIGGLQGRVLRDGDEVPVGPAPDPGDWHREALRCAPASCAPAREARSRAPIRVLPNPRGGRELDAARAGLVEQKFVVRPDSGRMGVRLTGERPLAVPPAVPSEGMVPGAIEVTPEGAPLVLLPARGTLGGYPVIATVILADIGRLAQRAPGAEVEFAPVTYDDARQLWVQEMRLVSEASVQWEQR